MSAVVRLVKDQDGFVQLERVMEIPREMSNPEGAYLSYRDIVGIVERLFRLSLQTTEYMYVVGFDTRMHVLGIMELAHGTEQECKFEMRELFSALMLMRASRFVLIHNHVHDVTTPSNADQFKTIHIHQIAEMMGFQFLNHIIVGQQGFSTVIPD